MLPAHLESPRAWCTSSLTDIETARWRTQHFLGLQLFSPGAHCPVHLEERKVLLNRASIRGICRGWRDKEWWYTGVLDPESQVYVSWYFLRVNVADAFVFSVFDPSRPGPEHLVKQIFYLEKPPESSREETYLVRDRRGFFVSYTGRGDGPEPGWSFLLKTKSIEAEIRIEPRRPSFTKFDNAVQDNYGLLNFFGASASGKVQAGGHTYELNSAVAYYDHCFGRIPEQTGWHWIAVQGDKFSLDSLINYGAYAQCYTQGWHSIEGVPRPGQWVRLEQAVSFENSVSFDDKDYLSWKKPWRLTSTDLDLNIEILQHKTDLTRVPPILPFLVKLHHTEAFVRVSGKARIDGVWTQTGDMFGVFEQHYGRW